MAGLLYVHGMLSAARVMVDGLCGEPHFVSAPLCQFLLWFIVYFPLNRNKMVDEMGVTYVCKCKKKSIHIASLHFRNLRPWTFRVHFLFTVTEAFPHSCLCGHVSRDAWFGSRHLLSVALMICSWWSPSSPCVSIFFVFLMLKCCREDGAQFLRCETIETRKCRNTRM